VGKTCAKKEKQNVKKIQENFNDHNEKRKLCYKYQVCHQSIYGIITNFKEKQNISNPKIPMTMKK